MSIIRPSRRDWISGLRPRHTPNFQPTFVWLAATAAQLGYGAEAREPAAVVLRRDPAFTIQKWLQLHQFVKQADADRVSEGLRVAGFPELVHWYVAIAQRLAMSELVQRISSLSNPWYESGHWRDAGRRSNVDLLGDV